MIKTPRRNAQHLLDHLEEWRPEGNGILATCPTHDDETPSLKIDINEDGRVLLYCRAGCEFADVATALGVNQGTLWRWPDELAELGELSSTPQVVGPELIADLEQYVAHTSGALPLSEAEEYALDRFGITPHMAKSLRLGLSHPESDVVWEPLKSSWRSVPRLVVPFLGFDGVPRGAQARALGDHDVKWTGLANTDDGATWARYAVMELNNGLDYVIITEGPSDGLTAYAAGYSAVVIRGAALGRQSELLEELAEHLKDRIVIVAGDADRSGEQFKASLVEHLTARGVDARPLALPKAHNDLNEWRQADAMAFRDSLSLAVREAPIVIDHSTIENTWDHIDPAHALADGVTHTATARALAWYVQATNRDLVHVQGFGLCIFDRGKYWLNPEGRELRQVIHEAQINAIRYENVNNPLHAKIKSMGQKLGMTYFINPVITELTSIVQASATADDFDSREDLLLVKNGVVNLRTGKLEEPRADMMLSNAVDYNYNPEAECPRWEQFVSEVMSDDPEMVAFMKRLIGYGITGSTKEQCFVVFQGNGANGKSVLTDALAYVFSAISKTVQFSIFETSAFGAGSGSGPSTHIARLRGSRLTLTSEGEEGKPMNEAVIKSLTGGDVVTARHMRAAEFEFRPQHLIIMSTNHMPRFKGVDEGLWRRVKIVKFDRYFAPSERDYTIDIQLRKEAEGILRWAVEGAREWYAGGLQEPTQVATATEFLRDALDPLNGFFPGVLMASDKHVTLLKKAYDEYTAWCDEEGISYPFGKQKFRSLIENRGHEYKRTKDGYGFVGVKLMSIAERQQHLKDTAEI